MLGIRWSENYSALATDLQFVEARQVLECVAGDAGDNIVFQVQSGEGRQVHERVAGDAGDGIRV